MLCKHKHAFTLGRFTGAAAARNNFGGPRVNNIKGYFNRIALAYAHLCVFAQVGVISRHNRLGSRPFMVLLQIHWIMSETDIAKTVTMNCGGGENVTLD